MNKPKKIAFIVSVCSIIIVTLIAILVLNFKNSTESVFLPLIDREEFDEMMILASELSELILDTLHLKFQDMTFEMETVRIAQMGERERLHFVVHCLTTGVNFGIPQSSVTGTMSSNTYNIYRSYINRLRWFTFDSWEELMSEEGKRLERTIAGVYGGFYVRTYTSDSYREDQGFPDGKTETMHFYHVTSFHIFLGWNVVDVDFIQEVAVPFLDVATLIETVGVENLSSIRISLSYDVFLEDCFNEELEIARIKMVLYEFLGEIQENTSEEITFELALDSRIDFIEDDGRVVARFSGSVSRVVFTLNELDEFDFSSFFIDVN